MNTMPSIAETNSLVAQLTFQIFPRRPRGRFRTPSMVAPVPAATSPKAVGDSPLTSPTEDGRIEFLLRPFQVEDASSLALHASQVKGHMPLGVPLTEAEAHRWIQLQLRQLERMKSFVKESSNSVPPILLNLAIVAVPYGRAQAVSNLNRKETLQIDQTSELLFEPQQGMEECIGSIGITMQSGLTSSVQIDYWLTESFWNKGIITAALKCFLKYYVFGVVASEPWGLLIHRVEARVLSENEKAQWILEKMGFRKEGVLRETLHRDGKWLSECMYGLVRDGLDNWSSPSDQD